MLNDRFRPAVLKLLNNRQFHLLFYRREHQVWLIYKPAHEYNL